LDGWLIKLRCFVNQTVKTETAQTFCCPTARLKQASNQENPIPKIARPKPLDIAKRFRLSPCNAAGTAALQKGMRNEGKGLNENC
jgi:hypothetical protein